MVKFKNKKVEAYYFLRRLRKNFYDNQYSERKHNYLDWRYILKVIEAEESFNKIHLCNTINEEIPNVPNNIDNWYNLEEKLKKENLMDFKELTEIEDTKGIYGDISPFLRAINLDQNNIVVGAVKEEDRVYTITDEIFNKANNNITNTKSSIVRFFDIYQLLEINKSKCNINERYSLLKMINRGTSWRESWAALGRILKERTRWTDDCNKVLNSLWFLQLCKSGEKNDEELLKVLTIGTDNILTNILETDTDNQTFLNDIKFDFLNPQKLPDYEALNNKFGSIFFYHIHNTKKGYIWMYFNRVKKEMPDIERETLVFDSYVEDENCIDKTNYHSLGNTLIRKDKQRKQNGFKSCEDCFNGICDKKIFQSFHTSSDKDVFIQNNNEILKKLYDSYKDLISDKLNQK